MNHFLKENTSIKYRILYIAIVLVLLLLTRIAAFNFKNIEFSKYTYIETKEFIITDKCTKTGILNLYIEIYVGESRPKILAPSTYLYKHIGDKVMVDIYKDKSLLRYKISDKEEGVYNLWKNY